jgi:outer membrane protein TolC
MMMYKRCGMRLRLGLWAAIASVGLTGATARIAEAAPDASATGNAAAFAPADTLRFSLTECVARALDQGEESGLADAELATVHAAYLQARSSALPRLSFGTSYTRQIKSAFGSGAMPDIAPFEPDTLADPLVRIRDLEEALPTAWLAGIGDLFSSTAFGSKNNWNASLGLTQKVFQGGSIWNLIAGARQAMSAARDTRRDRRYEIVLQVRQAYLGALLADRGAHIADLALAQTENQLQRVRLREETGNASEFELLQAEVQRDNQVPVVKQAYLLREVAGLELRRLANLPAGAPLALTTPLLEDHALPADPAAVDTTGLVAEALRAPGIRAAEDAAKAWDHAVAVAAADRWPGLSLFANYSRQAYPRDSFPKRDDWFEDINAGARLDWALFDGFLTKGAIEQSKARRRVAQQTLAQSREAVREIVIQAEYDLQRSASDLTARARTVQLARRAFELANIRYEEGASDLLEIADARTAYQMAQTHAAQARHDYFVALARLERYTGRPLFGSMAPQDPPARERMGTR